MEQQQRRPLIDNGDKAAWVEAVMRSALKPFAKCVAVGIAAHVDRFETGSARVSRKGIAAAIGGASLRGVEKALAEIEKALFVTIDKRQVGTDAEGRKVHGGWGGCNVYRLTLPAANGGSLVIGRAANGGSLPSSGTGANGGSLSTANGGADKSEPPFRQERTAVRTNLVIPRNIPSGVSRRASKDAPAPPMTWVLTDNPRWSQLTGGKSHATTAGAGGLGWWFLTAEVEAVDGMAA